MPPWALAVVVPVGFVVWWCFLLWVIGTFFSWGHLARRYPVIEPFHGTVRHFQSCQLGWSNYSRILTVGVNPHGLYLAVFFLFRPGHPPVFIPWADVSGRVVRVWVFGHWLELTFEKCPGVVIRLPRRVGDLIATEANRSWAGDGPGVE